jgi:hypothetical protein
MEIHVPMRDTRTASGLRLGTDLTSGGYNKLDRIAPSRIRVHLFPPDGGRTAVDKVRANNQI